MSTVTIVGISGSLRQGSYNTAALRAAAQLAPAGVRVELGSIHNIPLFDEDLEAREGLPEAVSVLKEQIASADGLLLATPEYNCAIPGVMKNAIDWVTRPFADCPRIFGGRPAAVIGATPIKEATASARAAWLTTFGLFGCRVFERSMGLPEAHLVFDKDGTLVDDKMAKHLREFMAEFVSFIQQPR